MGLYKILANNNFDVEYRSSKFSLITFFQIYDSKILSLSSRSSI